MPEEKNYAIEPVQRKVLLVIHDETLARQIARLLATNGYDVKLAADRASWYPEAVLVDAWGFKQHRHESVWPKPGDEDSQKVPMLFLAQPELAIDMPCEMVSMIGDYVNLPASDQEVVLRVKKLLR